MRKKYDRVNLKKDAAKLLGLKNAACGIILEAQSDETFAIKAFESPKVSRKKAVQNRVPTKKDVEKLMKTIQPIGKKYLIKIIKQSRKFTLN